MSTVTTTIRSRRLPAAARRTAWLAWSAFLLAFAILEGVNHGAAAWVALAGGLLAWMLHIAVDRVTGYNLRGQHGFIRA